MFPLIIVTILSFFAKFPNISSDSVIGVVDADSLFLTGRQPCILSKSTKRNQEIEINLVLFARSPDTKNIPLQNLVLYISRNCITVRNSSCGKVMFLDACVKNSVHSGAVYTPPWADTPLGRHTPGRHPLSRPTPPVADTSSEQTSFPPPRDGHCNGLYASYWNAFLFYN